jgi:secreted PhoX family phosphatase
MGAATRRGLMRAAGALPLAGLLPGKARALDMPPALYPNKPDDTVAPGYVRDVLVRWGDRVTFDAQPWDPRNPTQAAAETQFGWDGKIIGLSVPPAGADGVPRGVLAVAHPTVDPAMAFPGGVDRPEIAAVMQGASLLNVERSKDRWIVTDGGYQSRRLTANTLCRVSGGAADALGASVRGLLAVSGGCWTPWGTLLLTENDPGARLRGVDQRFGDPAGFGWVVELDAAEPTAVPVKRTSLGRFAHGDAAAALTRDGRAVVYMTDRRAGGHLLRFSSGGAARAADALDSGTLSVARVDGPRLRWLDLPHDPAALTDTAALAARLGGTGFGTPSGLAVDPQGGALFLACRGSPGASAPMPGQVLQILPTGGDHGADSAAVSALVQAGAERQGTAWPGHPDTVTADAAGRVWIGTDRGGRIGAVPDMLFGCETRGPGRGMPLPLYAAPRGAAVGGAALSPGGETLFAMVRTPGAEPGASWERPGTLWPAFDPTVPPRSTLVTFSRLRGGRVGG